MKDSFLLDTDVVIECLRRNREVLGEIEALFNEGSILGFSPVVRAEVYHGLRNEEEEPVSEFFSNLVCLPVTDEIGETAGVYLRQYHKSHGLELGNALIAATAKVNGVRLFTLNRRHYPMPDITVHEPARRRKP